MSVTLHQLPKTKVRKKKKGEWLTALKNDLRIFTFVARAVLAIFKDRFYNKKA